MRTKAAINAVLSRATGYKLVRDRPAQPAPPPPKEPAPRKPAPVKAAPIRHLKTTSEPGSRRARMFFDDYPRFYETSQTTPDRGRLNLRYEAIFGENADLFGGARVLDIASHDGRWSLAALKSGAAEVIGIEGRPELVANAEGTMAHYGVERDRYRFIAGDVFDVLAKEDVKVDVVLCLGFLYHTLRYNELFTHIRRTGARHLIIDTSIARTGMMPYVSVRTETVEQERNAVHDGYTFGDRVLVGQPSIKALRRILRAYGFRLERHSDWGGLLRDNPNLAGTWDYREGKRATFRCRAVD